MRWNPRRARRRPVSIREDHHLALRAGNDLGHGLRARPLLDEQELPAFEVEAGTAEEHDHLHGEGDGAVHVLVQAVVPAGFVAQEQRRGPALAGAGAARFELLERGGKALAPAEGLHPAVRDDGQGRVALTSQGVHERRQGMREVAVLADPEPVARHVDVAAERAGVVPERGQARARLRRTAARQRRVGPLAQVVLDGAPVRARDLLADLRHRRRQGRHLQTIRPDRARFHPVRDFNRGTASAAARNMRKWRASSSSR